MNWFARHLNWTYVLANLFLSLLVAIAWEARIAGFAMYPIAGWVIIQKGRSLWWLLLAPVCSPLWLANKKTELSDDKRANYKEKKEKEVRRYVHLEPKKTTWWVWSLLVIGILLIIGGVFWLISSIDNPQFTKSEIIALVKNDLTKLGVAGHQIESVDSVSAVTYIGDGKWQGVATVSYSYLASSFPHRSLEFQDGDFVWVESPAVSETYTEQVNIRWTFHEKLTLTEIN